MRIFVIGLIALSGMAWAAPDLNDDFDALKAAVEGKDAAKVKELAPQVSKESKCDRHQGLRPGRRHRVRQGSRRVFRIRPLDRGGERLRSADDD